MKIQPRLNTSWFVENWGMEQLREALLESEQYQLSTSEIILFMEP
jgi:hypothetical protein